MYITEKMWVEKDKHEAGIRLIWKTTDNSFKQNVVRYRNNTPLVALIPEQFRYSRRGDYLVAESSGNYINYPLYWVGIGEWRIDPKIRGNVRGCL